MKHPIISSLAFGVCLAAFSSFAGPEDVRPWNASTVLQQPEFKSEPVAAPSQPASHEATAGVLSRSALREALASMGAHGLHAGYYQEKFNRLPQGDREALQGFLKELIADLRFGATRERDAWHRHQPVIERELARLSTCGDLTQCLQTIAARHPQYEPLQMMLSAYQRVAASGGWPRIEAGGSLRPGETDRRVPTLRSFLRLSGDYRSATAGAPSSYGPDQPDLVYDAGLEQAVKRFQRRHGLSDDGVIGPKTREVMNVPVEDRIAQLRLSLERLRKLPDPGARRYVHVNIPSFTLSAYENTAKILEMPVIVGQRSRKTPLFDNVITTVGLNPTWTPTQSILRKDILPKFRHDPDYALRGGYTVRDRITGQRLDPHMIDWHSVSARDVQVVQRSGRSNALGKVKFLLPNNQSVYLHDTSKPYLFKKSMRALSSGCIRLSDPEAFLDFVIAAQPDERFGKLRDYYAASKNRHIALDQPVPVTVTYFTAWVNDDGEVGFYDDIYGRDNRLKLALEQETRTLAMK